MDNYEQVNRVNLQFHEEKLEGAYASLRVPFKKSADFLNVPTTILSCAAKPLN